MAVLTTRVIQMPTLMRVPADHPKLLIASIADDFDRGNSAVLGSTPLGAKAWTNATGVQIINKTLDMSAVTGLAWPRFASGFANYDLDAKVAAIGSTSAEMAGGVLVRFASTTDYYWLSTRISAGQIGCQFYRTAGGVTTPQGASSPIPVEGGDDIRITADGDTLAAFVNGAPAASLVGVHTPTATLVGFLGHPAGVKTKWASIAVRQRP